MKHHGTVNKHSLEQELHKSNVITFAHSEVMHTSGTIGSYGRLAGSQEDIKFEFKIHYRSIFIFYYI